MKIEEGTFAGADNTPSAEAEIDERAYFLRKRLIGIRSVVVLLPIAGVLAIWWPMLGLDLALGGICGVVNMLLVMRNNERLLVGGRSRGTYGLSNTLRIVVIGLVPVGATVHHPWWFMFAAIAGLFAPLVLYSFELRREMSTG